MAGIGFVLRKLYKQDNLSGLVAACFHSAFASAGPWLFTVAALGAIAALGRALVGVDVLMRFQSVLIYNFAFSLVLSGPLFMVITRHLSDAIYRRDVSGAIDMLFGALVVLWGIDLIFIGAFYTLYANMDAAMTLSAIANFMLLSAVWLVGLFVSALRNYKLTTAAFFGGMTIAILCCAVFAKPFGAVGLINGFNIGLMMIVGILLGNVLSEFPYGVRTPFAFLRCSKQYWQIALGGLVYNLAIWVDKWVMWAAPEATRLPNNLTVYPTYDSTMFIAYLTTVPVMALFLFSTETTFFEHYTRFYRDIQKKASFAKIEKNQNALIRSLSASSINFVVLQACLALLGALLAPEIVEALKGTYKQIGIMRFGMFGAFFQILTLFLIVILTYFDNRKACLQIQCTFLFSNLAFSLLSLAGGFATYGMGYFFATFVTFMLAAYLTTGHVKKLAFHTFITANSTRNG